MDADRRDLGETPAAVRAPSATPHVATRADMASDVKAVAPCAP